MMLAVVNAVAEAPPPQFSGGGKWEAMHGDMAGHHEIRVDGPKRHHYRLFCPLERDGVSVGLGGPSLVLICGKDKPFRTVLSPRDYAEVRRLGSEYLGRRVRSVVRWSSRSRTDATAGPTTDCIANKFDVVAKRRSQPDERGERGVRALLREQSAHDLRVSVDGRRKAGLADAGLLARGVECPHYLVDGVHLCACLGTVVIQTEIIVLAGDETHAEIVAKHIVEDEWPARDLRKSFFRFQAQPMSHLPVGCDENEFPEDNTLEEPERTIRELIEGGAAPRMCS
jgi:hypothetical protein